MPWRAIFVAAALSVGSCSCEPPRTVSQGERDGGGLACRDGEVARAGRCFCQLDRACAAGEYCEAVTGTCQTKPVEVPPDAGVRACTTGATRCAPAPKKAIQKCDQGVWSDIETCTADGVCAASAGGYFCSLCAPGATRCKGADHVEVCSEKGDRWDASPCPVDPQTKVPANCVASRCQLCVPGKVRCSADGTSTETCQMDGAGFSTQYCSPTGKCDPATSACVPPFCQPGSRQCKDAFTLKECALDGSKLVEKDCRTLDAHSTPAAVCQMNDCQDPCGKAARDFSYEGCDYWATVTSNSELDGAFRGRASDGSQPSNTSEFAIVVSNPNTQTANVKVTRKVGGVERLSPSNPAANGQGQIPVPSGGLVTIRLPWQSVAGTGRAPYAFHLVSDQPINAYQFNPVTSALGGTNSFTNDASLLVPSHILGTSYVVLGQEHITIQAAGITACLTDDDCPGPGNRCQGFLITACAKPPVLPVPGFFSIVGTKDNTQVTLRFSASTVRTSPSGMGNIAAYTKGATGTFTVNRYDVLQFWTGTDGPPAQCGPSDDPRFADVCRYNSDPTGTIVTSTEPIAVFAGADCTFKPFGHFACDHIEEEMVPFATWGKSYAGAKSALYRKRDGLPVTQPSPDYWRVVAGCGKKDCPLGTKVTIAPAPLSVLQSQYCAGNVCTLPPVDPAAGVVTASWLEFTHGGDFTVQGDQPIMLAQYFTGENANPQSVEGDPSLILTPPIEQWRSSYNVLTSTTFGHNYLSLIAQSSSPGIKINGRDLNPQNFPGLATSTIPGGFSVFRVPVAGGAQAITAASKLGVTVYGFDPFVSYGYTGGLDLQRITQINPGG